MLTFTQILQRRYPPGPDQRVLRTGASYSRALYLARNRANWRGIGLFASGTAARDLRAWCTFVRGTRLEASLPSRYCRLEYLPAL